MGYKMENEEYFEANIMNELHSIRDDINTLATFINIKEENFKNLTQEINKDLRTLEEDMVEKVKEIIKEIEKNPSSTNVGVDTSYIQQLIKDDFKDMQTNLLNQIREIVFKNQNGDKK